MQAYLSHNTRNLVNVLCKGRELCLSFTSAVVYQEQRCILMLDLLSFMNIFLLFTQTAFFPMVTQDITYKFKCFILWTKTLD